MTNRWQYWCYKTGVYTLGSCKRWAGEYVKLHLHKWVCKPAICANGVACIHAHMLLQLEPSSRLPPPCHLPCNHHWSVRRTGKVEASCSRSSDVIFGISSFTSFGRLLLWENSNFCVAIVHGSLQWVITAL